MIKVISLPHMITWCNDFSYMKGRNRKEKITSGQFRSLKYPESNTMCSMCMCSDAFFGYSALVLTTPHPLKSN